MILVLAELVPPPGLVAPLFLSAVNFVDVVGERVQCYKSPASRRRDSARVAAWISARAVLRHVESVPPTQSADFELSSGGCLVDDECVAATPASLSGGAGSTAGYLADDECGLPEESNGIEGTDDISTFFLALLLHLLRNQQAISENLRRCFLMVNHV